MSGALVALVSKGIQDSYILNFAKYKANFKSFSNFSQAVHQLTIVGNVTPGGVSEIPIIYKGDIINHLWFEVLNETSVLKDTVFELYIGSQLIDTISYDYCVDIWSVYLAENRAKSSVINNTISMSDRTFFPLHFFFCDYNNFLPLIALSNTSVSIKIRWGNYVNGQIKAYANFMYIDDQSRRKIVQTTNEYFINQVQRVIINQSLGNISADLSSINHPIRYLFWGHPSISDELDRDFFSFQNAKIQINGSDIMDKMSPSYYHTVQSYYNNPNALINFVNDYNCPFYTRYFMYNFGQSCCNFSRLDSVCLEINGITRGNLRQSENLYVYAVGYNILKVSGGLAGILFSN